MRKAFLALVLLSVFSAYGQKTARDYYNQLNKANGLESFAPGNFHFVVVVVVE